MSSAIPIYLGLGGCLACQIARSGEEAKNRQL